MVIALFIALLLEVYFYSADNSVTTNIPAMVEVRGLAAEKIIVEPPKGEKGIPVRIEVRGPRPLVEGVRSSMNKFIVTMPPTDPSEFTAFLDPQQLKLPAGVEVLSINPASVTIKTELISQKELPVIAERVGKPADGHQISAMEVIPGTVSIRGPQSKVDHLRTLLTYPIDVGHLKNSEQIETSLQVPDPLVTLSVSAVKVDVQVEQIRETRTFDSVPVRVFAPNGYAATISPARAMVVLSGPADQIRNLGSSEIFLIADARVLTEGKHRLALTGDFGPNVRVERTVPEEVSVTIMTRQNG